MYRPRQPCYPLRKGIYPSFDSSTGRLPDFVSQRNFCFHGPGAQLERIQIVRKVSVFQDAMRTLSIPRKLISISLASKLAAHPSRHSILCLNLRNSP